MTFVNRSEMAAASGDGGGDRLSGLPDATLTAILCHLPTDDAVRTSVLSRRWRHVFATLPVVHLVDRRTKHGYYERDQVCFEQQVSAALLARQASAPIRAFRVRTPEPSSTLLDQWVLLALCSGAEEMEVDLEARDDRRLCPFAPKEDSSADFRNYVVLNSLPRQLFSAGSSLRSLRLCNCKIDLPSGDIQLTKLETLVLRRVGAAEDDVQRVISSCPRLADLTLDQCPSATEITVPNALLRTFAIVCCHNATRVKLETPCLRSLTYRGSCTEHFLVDSCTEIKSISMDICEDFAAGRTSAKAASFTGLIRRCTELTSLHLSLRPSMAYNSWVFVNTLTWLRGLCLLELKGCLADDHSIRAVVSVLQSVQNLRELSLFLLSPKQAKKQNHYSRRDTDSGKIDYNCKVDVPKGLWNSRIDCLKHTLGRISVMDYNGRPAERTLLKLLLAKAKVLKELEVTFGAECASHQDELRSEISSWQQDQHIKVIFSQGEKIKL